MTSPKYITGENFVYSDADQDGGKTTYTLASTAAKLSDDEVFNLVRRHTDGLFSPDSTHCQCGHDCCGRWYKGDAEVVRINGQPIAVTQAHWVNC